MISVFLTCPHQPQGGSITPSSRQTEKNSTSTFPLSDSVRFFDISHFSWRTTNVCLWVLGYYIYVSRCVFLHHFCSNVHCFFNCDHRWTCHIHTYTHTRVVFDPLAILEKKIKAIFFLSASVAFYMVRERLTWVMFACWQSSTCSPAQVELALIVTPGLTRWQPLTSSCNWFTRN